MCRGCCWADADDAVGGTQTSEVICVLEVKLKEGQHFGGQSLNLSELLLSRDLLSYTLIIIIFIIFSTCLFVKSFLKV